MAITEDFWLDKPGVEGDVVSRRFRVWDLRGLTVTKAYLTVKAAYGNADPGLFQKAITTSNVAGTGQIEDDGGSSDCAILRFDLSATNTRVGTPGDANVYDVQIHLSDGQVITQWRGPFVTNYEVTAADS